jgi:hypothetical protein
MQGDVWGVWLSGAPVPPDSIEFYARQLAAHSIEPDHIHRLTPQQLVAIGFLAADAEQTVKKKKKKKKKTSLELFVMCGDLDSVCTRIQQCFGRI